MRLPFTPTWRVGENPGVVLQGCGVCGATIEATAEKRRLHERWHEIVEAGAKLDRKGEDSGQLPRR